MTTQPEPKTPVHFVTVEHEHDDDGDVVSSTLTFECRADADAPCHIYPACYCEQWDDEHDKVHPRVQHDECWLKGWFDAGYDATPYSPPDDDGEGSYDSFLSSVPAGSGPIEHEYDEGIYWWWTA